MYAQAARRAGLSPFYFALEDVDTGSGLIRGWRERIDGRWGEVEVEKPPVVYDRSMGRDDNEHDRRARVWLNQGCVFVNSISILDKWAAHAILAKVPETAVFLPETVRYDHPADLARMLNSYGSVLVKPVDRGQGYGIWHVRWHDRRHAGVEMRLTGTNGVRIADVDRAYRQLITTARGQRLIIQQQIPLLRVGRGRSDIRALACKDTTDKWAIIGLNMKAGKPGMFVTNWSQGGAWIGFDDGLRRAGLSTAATRKAAEDVKAAALLICRTLESAAGKLGEVGIDLAFDEQMKLWFIEANLMPGKNPAGPDTYAICLWRCEQVMKYARHLIEAPSATDVRQPHLLEAADEKPDQSCGGTADPA
jgi:glutathione synthase/RimK-type ligase-like ATP-grasp enzyme